VVTAVMIFNRSRRGALLGIVIAALNALAQLVAIGGYPAWSVIVLVVDGLVIYGLCVYGLDEAA
jgi:uncharacterized membrane protein YjfL (UPF0719 family)